MPDSKDEKVDGPQIAARILNRLPEETKSRLIEALQVEAPEVARKVETLLVSFDNVTELSAQGIQTLVKGVEHKDLVLSLSAASPEVKQTILANVSSRKQQMIAEDLSNLPKAGKLEIQEAQRRILGILENLRGEGKVRTESKNDVWV